MTGRDEKKKNRHEWRKMMIMMINRLGRREMMM